MSKWTQIFLIPDDMNSIVSLSYNTLQKKTKEETCHIYWKEIKGPDKV